MAEWADGFVPSVPEVWEYYRNEGGAARLRLTGRAAALGTSWEPGRPRAAPRL